MHRFVGEQVQLADRPTDAIDDNRVPVKHRGKCLGIHRREVAGVVIGSVAIKIIGCLLYTSDAADE